MKPFAILSLDKLKIRYFDTEDEMKNSVSDLRSQNIPVIVLKYHHSAELYTQLQPWG